MATRANPHQQHLETAREADLSRLSAVSVVAGLVSAYGAFAVVAAIVGAVLSSVDAAPEFRTDDWTGSGTVAGLATAVTLLAAYFFGGYVAGRMARRSGVLHGVAVFLASLVIAAVVVGLVAALADDATLQSNLRSVGIPTTWSQVGDVALASLAASVIAMLVGAVLGGARGEHWHTALARRVADPTIGASATARRRADEDSEERRRTIEQDPALAAELSEVEHRRSHPDLGDDDATRIDLDREAAAGLPGDDGHPAERSSDDDVLVEGQRRRNQP